MKKMLKKISVLLILAMIVGIFQTGEVFAKAKYDDVGAFRKGMASVGKDGKYGYINKKGEEVIKLKYDDAIFFSEGIASVREGDNWYIIDKKGKVIRKI